MSSGSWHPCCESDWRQGRSVSSHRLFFLHVPKTGGITVENVLKRYFAWQHLCPRYYVSEWKGFSAVDAQRYRLFIGHSDINVAAALPDEARLAIVLRNPLSQTLSLYNHIVERPTHALHEMVTKDRVGIDDFIEMRDFQNFQAAFLLGWEEWRRRPSDFDLGAATETAIASLDRFHVVGTTEDLPRFFAGLTTVLGVPPIRDWPHLNSARRQAVRIDEISPETVQRHRELSSIDYAVYARALERCDPGSDMISDGARPAA